MAHPRKSMSELLLLSGEKGKGTISVSSFAFISIDGKGIRSLQIYITDPLNVMHTTFKQCARLVRYIYRFER
jgi:hypothetical protein